MLLSIFLSERSERAAKMAENEIKKLVASTVLRATYTKDEIELTTSTLFGYTRVYRIRVDESGKLDFVEMAGKHEYRKNGTKTGL